MPKGLQRSISRASRAEQTIVREFVPINNLIVTVAAAVGNPGFGGAAFGKLPEGLILLLGAIVRYTIDDQGSPVVVDTFSPNVAIGTSNTPAAGPSFNLTTNQNITGPSLGNAAVAGVSTDNLIPSDNLKSGESLDNTADDLQLFFNILFTNPGDMGNGTVPMLINGELIYLYSIFGDD